MRPMPGRAISRQELFERLAEGLAAQLTVVTPNRRLAQALAREFDAGQAARGLPVWEAADILPLSAFVERLYEDALTSGLAPGLPLALSEAQEIELWEQVIRASPWGGELLDPSRAATQAARAWRLAHGWRIAGALGALPGNEDAQAFARWAAAYARHDSTDAARLPDVVAPLLGEAALRTPQLLVAYAFDVVTPQEREFFDACAARGIEVKACEQESTGSTPRRVVFQSARHELEAAAEWARAKVQAGAGRIGVVLPELAQRRREVLRVFARAMNPAHAVPGSESPALPFNVSLGEPLADDPARARGAFDPRARAGRGALRACQPAGALALRRRRGRRDGRARAPRRQAAPQRARAPDARQAGRPGRGLPRPAPGAGADVFRPEARNRLRRTSGASTSPGCSRPRAFPAAASIRPSTRRARNSTRRWPSWPGSRASRRG